MQKDQLDKAIEIVDKIDELTGLKNNILKRSTCYDGRQAARPVIRIGWIDINSDQTIPEIFLPANIETFVTLVVGNIDQRIKDLETEFNNL